MDSVFYCNHGADPAAFSRSHSARNVKADFHEANVSLRIRSETILRMRCDVCDFVEKSPRILEEIHMMRKKYEMTLKHISVPQKDRLSGSC